MFRGVGFSGGTINIPLLDFQHERRLRWDFTGNVDFLKTFLRFRACNVGGTFGCHLSGKKTKWILRRSNSPLLLEAESIYN